MSPKSTTVQRRARYWFTPILATCFLLPSDQYNNADTIEELPITEPSKLYFTTVVIHSNKDNISLPFNANLGFVRPMTAEDHSDFHQAAEDTSKQLSSVWSTFVQCQYAQF